MSEGYSGKQFFFIGRAAENKDHSNTPPLDPRSYVLQPGLRPLRDKLHPTPSRKAIEAVEKALEKYEDIQDAG